MSNKKTPEQDKADYIKFFGVEYPGGLVHRDALNNCRRGRDYFIKNELPKLLKLAREFEAGTWGCHRYSIADLIAMAEKGEV